MTEQLNAEITDAERAGIGVVIDVILPGTEVLPRATEVNAHGELLDRVLAADPTLAPIVRAAGSHAAAAPGCTYGDLEAWMGEDLERLVFALHAAYYMSSEVRTRLGYPGQGRYPVALATPDQLCSDELIAPVVERGDIFVPTPDGSQ